MLFAMTAVMAQNNNCKKLTQLVAKANHNEMNSEMTGKAFMNSEDFEAWTAATTLDGATKCYVQEAGRASKMYLAEFGSSDKQSADPVLSQKADDLINSIKTCFNGTFAAQKMKSDGFIFKAIQFTGKAENANTTITVLLVYNPAEKKQTLSLNILHD